MERDLNDSQTGSLSINWSPRKFLLPFNMPTKISRSMHLKSETQVEIVVFSCLKIKRVLILNEKFTPLLDNLYNETCLITTAMD